MKEIKLTCIQKIKNNKLFSVVFKNEENQIHNEYGIAFVSYYENGNTKSEVYSLNNKFHNENGPACTCYDYENGNIVVQKYYLNDKPLSKEEWENEIQKKNFCDGKIIDIDGVKYKLSIV